MSLNRDMGQSCYKYSRDTILQETLGDALTSLLGTVLLLLYN